MMLCIKAPLLNIITLHISSDINVSCVMCLSGFRITSSAFVPKVGLIVKTDKYGL